MSAQDNWLANLRALVDAIAPGTIKRAGYREVASRAGIDEEYVYQLYTGRKKTVGPDKARSIARAFANGRDLSWIDLPPDAAGPISQAAESQPGDKQHTEAQEAFGWVNQAGLFLSMLDPLNLAMASAAIRHLAEHPYDSGRVRAQLQMIYETVQRQLDEKSAANPASGELAERAAKFHRAIEADYRRLVEQDESGITGNTRPGELVDSPAAPGYGHLIGPAAPKDKREIDE